MLKSVYNVSEERLLGHGKAVKLETPVVYGLSISVGVHYLNLH